jgi:hypothetical protein
MMGLGPNPDGEMYTTCPTFTTYSTCIKIGKYRIIGQNSHWVEKVKNLAK